MADSYAPGWYPDPMGRHEHRWFDGQGWTEHVTSAGAQGIDPIGPGPSAVPRGDHAPVQVQKQVQRAAGAPPGALPQGGGTVFTEPVLVVNQKAKYIEINSEYAVYDQHGNQIAAVRQIGQSATRKVARALTNFDQYMTHQFQVVDLAGNVLLNVTRPAKFMKSKVIVAGPQGHEIGQIVQENLWGKIRFAMVAGGHQYGAINAENWRAWNFTIVDHTGAEVGRITKTYVGLAKAVFTTADNYVVQIHRPLDDPLRTLVVAAALTVDTALKQYES